MEEAVSSSTSAPLPSPYTTDRLHSLVNQLPPRPVAEALVDVFFSEANWYFLVLERYYFNSLYSSWLADTHIYDIGRLPLAEQCFPALFFQVLAVALQFLPLNTAVSKVLHLQDYNACDRLSEKYSSAGAEIMQLLGRHKPTLTAVQADLMRAVWLKNCSRGTESWYSMADAIRSTIAPHFKLHTS